MTATSHPQHAAIRPEWLASRSEDVVDPDLPIVDAHQHMYDRPGNRYLLDEAVADLCSGHSVRATVYVQARAMYRATGPDHLKPVGETEFANGIAAMSASGDYGKTQLCAAIVGSADLMLGSAVRPVLEAHLAAAPERFRGVRHVMAWDPDPSLLNPAYTVDEAMLASPDFRAGFAQLGELGLTFDAWMFFHQLPRLTQLAQAFPEVPIVLDHCGGILGIGPYKGHHDEVHQTWQTGLRGLAECPNVHVKLGGLGMRMCGFGLSDLDQPAASADIAAAWRPWMETCIDLFGTDRCMFESNFPVDKSSCSYPIYWNALKKVVCEASVEEKNNLFWRTAADFYRITPDVIGQI